MLTVKLTFLNQHYHATPWGSQVNEGHVEWPPSPWRLSRALIATAFTKLTEDELDLPLLKRLIERLASAHPEYALPSITSAHTRHYVPQDKEKKEDWLKKGTYKTTLMLDSYAIVKEPLYVSWDSELSDDERALAEALFPRLSYLGRAESWVDASVLAEGERPPTASNCRLDEGGPLLPHEELVEVLSPQRSEEYMRWYQAAEAVALEPHPLPEGKKPTKGLLNKRAKATEHLPTDLFACLTVESAWLKKMKWSEAPGSRRSLYRLCRASAPHRTQGARRSLEGRGRVEAMLIALSTDHIRNVYLPLTEALELGERLHRALVSQAALGERINHEVLVGCQADGAPTKGHVHLHILPVTRGRATHIDHLLVWSPVGLDAEAQRAVRSVRHLSGRQRFNTHVVGEGSRASLTRSLSGGASPELLSPARVWESWTPFVPPKYLKERGKKRLEAQVIAELMARGLIDDESAVEVVRLSASECSALRLQHFKLKRSRRAPQPPMTLGFGLRLVFKEPVMGPIALGYASHFGLGVFRAVEGD